MQLAILHHHLNRGGVTSVIANHLRSLATLPADDRLQRVLVFFDGQRDGWPDDLPDAFPIEMVVEPAMAYDQPGDRAEPTALADRLAKRFAECGLTPDDTLLHTHNHSLGKNASLPGALARLADDGWRVLLQIHDFAEDNRPANYQHLQESIGEEEPDRLGAVLYPQGKGIHYATLTQRDADILRGAGFAEQRLHVLPNPVAEFTDMPSMEAARSRVFPVLGLPPEARLIVYPVRGIRRKNLGEMLLLSALAPEETYFAVTLRPKNPVEAASFDRWRRLAESLDLACRFDTGGPIEEGGYGCDFKDTLAAADAILTTSVAEGFGMVFLEAWLAGKPLIGRDLPEITREFKAAGMRFDGMWDELRAAANLDSDFGRLTAAEQIVALHETIRPAVPLDFGADAAGGHVEQNAAAVLATYSLGRLGERLFATYSGVAGDSESGGAVRPVTIFEHFADPDRRLPICFEAATADPLADTISRLSHAMEAAPTGERPSVARLPAIRAVVFDVYGTLLISGSGDISLASEGGRGAAVVEALQAVRDEQTTPPGGTPWDGDAIVAELHAAIHASHERSESEHPEVEIREVWAEALRSFDIKLDAVQIERLAVEYECRVNPIWAMPGLGETLRSLADSGIELGIVSNAQFFTPLAFEPLTGMSLDRWGFDPSICVWSYEHREAKPGTFLYERCAEGLDGLGIHPEEALFVGNDLRNDVWPAQRVGFKTALFAGDARSLRWRRDDPRLTDVRPDAIVTDLRQLLEIAL